MPPIPGIIQAISLYLEAVATRARAKIKSPAPQGQQGQEPRKT